MSQGTAFLSNLKGSPFGPHQELARGVESEPEERFYMSVRGVIPIDLEKKMIREGK